MANPLCPSLYQINTRVWLTQLSDALGRRATLDDIPDAELDRLSTMGFDWIWFLSVWKTGPAGQRVSRASPEWRREFQDTLADLREEDIAGSGFAITGDTVHDRLGGDAALARLRERLRARGLRLLLDFVPNHTALDHPWVEEHPEYYIEGSEQDLAHAPQNYTRSIDGEEIWCSRTDATRTFLLAVLHDPTVCDGNWRLLESTPAWEGNWTSDCFVACLWTSAADDRRLVAVNYAGNQSQCYLRLPPLNHGHEVLRFDDRMGAGRFDRDAHDLDARGLYLDMPAWGYHVFDITANDERPADETPATLSSDRRLAVQVPQR